MADDTPPASAESELARPPAGLARTELRTYPEIVWTDAVGLHRVALTGPLVLGSARRLAQRIADPTVDRLHAELDNAPDGTISVRDLGTRSGTLVDGVRVGFGYAALGSRIQVGGTLLSVRPGTAPSSVERWADTELAGLLGTSPGMRELFARLARVARADTTVLLTGEAGTGKTAAAEALHRLSPRADAPFLVLDAARLDTTDFETVLCGVGTGPFGGGATRPGALASAEGGTLLLRGIDELSWPLQRKLVTLLDARAYRAVGDEAYTRFDVRFLAAARRDLRELVNGGSFDEDLYFRLAALTLRLPPLRERSEDVPLLVRAFAGAASLESLGLDDTALAELARRSWPTNVAGLRAYVELLTGGDEAPRASWVEAPEDAPRDTELSLPPASAVEDEPLTLVRARWLARVERVYLTTLVAEHGRDVRALAAAARVRTSSIERLLARYGL